MEQNAQTGTEQQATVTAATETTETQQAAAPQGEANKPSVDGHKDIDTTKKLALLARKEQEILNYKKAVEAEKAQIEQERQKYKEYQEKIEAIKNKDWAKVSDLIDYNDLTKSKLNGLQPTPEALLEKFEGKILQTIEEKFKSKEEESKKYQQEAAENHKKAVENQWKIEIKDELSKKFSENENALQLLSVQSGFEEAIVETIKKYHDETGRVLKTHEAAEMVEKTLEDQFTKDVEKYIKLPKVKAMLEKHFKPIEEEKKDISSIFKQQDKPKTLTNSVQPASPSPAQTSRFDKEKSLEEAAKLIKWV